MAKTREAKPRKSRAKGRTAAEQFATAQRRIEEAREDGTTKLDFMDLPKLAALAPELAGLTPLQSLDLRDTQVSDLTPLAGLTALQSLGLWDTQVRDLAPLAGLIALQSLDLTGTQVRDLAPLAGLAALQSLDLRSTQVSDLGPLAHMTEMLDAITSTNAIRSRRARGLEYVRTPIAAKAHFDRIVQLGQPARTVETINEVRRRRGLPEHTPDGYERPASDEGPGTSLEPLPGIPSAFGFQLSGGKISLTSSPVDWPVFLLPTSERDHKNRLEASRTLAQDLASDLRAGRFNARPDYVDSLTKYAQRLPERPGDGNILLADAEARTLRTMFAADADALSIGFASTLKTVLEQHIGLRVFYPEIEHFYRDVQAGRIEEPLPLDAVHGFVRGVQTHTPAIFDRGVGDAIAGSAERGPETPPLPAGTPAPADPDQPRPPPDPLGEIDPQKARDFTVAGAVNGLWKAFRQGEKVNKAVEGWKKAGETLQPHAQKILEWLRNFTGPGDGAPPLPPGISI